ncbi:hypothetical protein [Sphaerisporangium sp. TRM90804]|uniref:hypothetical protein n=1 Tax=Sphaerisporangium sp. TRM90804 TaxID=3031113 RepID=UPI00244815F2|nr:hypothetical protein [Sphaerisporangium sp. TRM90804]MDH2428210.1 hypothetical protein [Sphaerisporangium sp. TRM90804]
MTEVLIISENPRQTGDKAASDAGKTLAGQNATDAEKSAAASALSQAPESTGQTGEKAASDAGETLGSKDATKTEKSAAASALSQTPSDEK